MANPVERLRQLVSRRGDTTPEARQAKLEKFQRREQAKAVRLEHKRRGGFHGGADGGGGIGGGF